MTVACCFHVLAEVSPQHDVNHIAQLLQLTAPG